jgi:8-oxo-dGTP diphosphatase
MKQIEGVAAILIVDSKIAAFRRNHGKFSGFYEFVGGKIEPLETREEALVRECYEELQIDITIESPFKTIHYDYDDFSLVLHTFVCQPKTLNMILSVHDDLVWVDELTIDSLNWLPADKLIMDDLKMLCLSLKQKNGGYYA